MSEEYGANIVDISQSVVGEYFAMIMLVELDEKDLCKVIKDFVMEK